MDAKGAKGTYQWRGEMDALRDDDNVLASLQFHDDRFETNDHITIRLASTIAIVVFIVITGLEILRILLRNLLILCKPVRKLNRETNKERRILTVIPSQTPLSNSSSAFHCNFSQPSSSTRYLAV